MVNGTALAARNGDSHLARICPEEKPAVMGCNGSQPKGKPEDKPERFVWHIEKGAPRNYRKLGKAHRSLERSVSTQQSWTCPRAGATGRQDSADHQG